MRGTPPTRKELAHFMAQDALVRQQQRESLAVRAQSAGLKKEKIRAPNGLVETVWASPRSYLSMGLEDHQQRAAERFEEDWINAYRPLKGQGFEPGVDCGNTMHGMHYTQLDAQARLNACRLAISERSFDIVVAIAINGGRIAPLSKRAKIHHISFRQTVSDAFNDLAAFYSKSRREDRAWTAVRDFNNERKRAVSGRAEHGG